MGSTQNAATAQRLDRIRSILSTKQHNEADLDAEQSSDLPTPTTIPRKKIHLTFSFTPNKKPLRYHYDQEEIRQWAEKELKPNGIRNPLWIRPHPTIKGEYELVAGCRRYYASAYIEEDPPVRIFEWDDTSAYRAAIAENAHRQNFNALEETDYILHLLALAIESTPEVAVSLLYQLANIKKRQGNQNVLVHPQYPLVQAVFEYVGNISWESFTSSRLPLLKKPEDILTAIRQGKIDYTKGLEIAKIPNLESRQNLLEEAVTGQLSVAEIKQRTKDLKLSVRVHKLPSSTLKQRWGIMHTKISRSKVWEDPQKSKNLEKLLTQLEQMLES